MARILITSGPTRQYLDPVRYLTNASSGRMGRELAAAALELGHEVIVVSGPVSVEYPAGAQVRPVVSTEELLAACQELFPACDGAIGAAAPCDYRPLRVEQHKIAKTGQPLVLNLVETPDVMATLGASKRAGQWLVGFALETDDQRFRALTKLDQKKLRPDRAQRAGRDGRRRQPRGGARPDRRGHRRRSPAARNAVARGILRTIQQRLID